MKKIFPQADELQINNSLVNAESYFLGANASGLIEQRFSPDRTAVRIFASGKLSKVYMLESGEAQFIPLTELASLHSETSQLRAIKFPDVAGRLTWLALESQAGDKYSISGEDDWNARIDQWKQDQWSGLIEVAAKTIHGFALFWQGETQKTEIIFSTAQGFITDFPRIENADVSLWETTTYAFQPSTHAYECAFLRHGAMRWSHQILSRYREMVGQKLLQTLGRELNREIQPRRWNISLDGDSLLDRHFFPYLMDTAHAYRTMFMSMGAQMDFVIGNNLTKRLLSETFGQVRADERAILQSQHLIPAAFSE